LGTSPLNEDYPAPKKRRRQRNLGKKKRIMKNVKKIVARTPSRKLGTPALPNASGSRGRLRTQITKRKRKATIPPRKIRQRPGMKRRAWGRAGRKPQLKTNTNGKGDQENESIALKKAKPGASRDWVTQKGEREFKATVGDLKKTIPTRGPFLLRNGISTLSRIGREDHKADTGRQLKDPPKG